MKPSVESSPRWKIGVQFEGIYLDGIGAPKRVRRDGGIEVHTIFPPVCGDAGRRP